MDARKRLIPAQPAQHHIRHAEACTKGPRTDRRLPSILALPHRHPAFFTHHQLSTHPSKAKREIQAVCVGVYSCMCVCVCVCACVEVSKAKRRGGGTAAGKPNASGCIRRCKNETNSRDETKGEGHLAYTRAICLAGGSLPASREASLYCNARAKPACFLRCTRTAHNIFFPSLFSPPSLPLSHTYACM
jgi:hypothetical protein